MEPTNNYIHEHSGTLPAHPYRGIRPFRYADREIFAARDWEKEQLLNLISLYKGSLMYGESGIGKSSLINAGLIPELQEHNFQAEVIRVSPSREGTFIVYRTVASDSDRGGYLPSIFAKYGDTKALNISINELRETLSSQKYATGTASSDEHDAPVPVLIFDQFEELITLFEETATKDIAENELSFEERKMLQAELIDIFRASYYDATLRVKFLFVFREDYLAKLSKLLRAIPDLRDHTLRVKAIAKEDMLAIIEQPFLKDIDQQVYPDPFTTELTRILTLRLMDHFGENNAALTDIQIACQYIYETPAGEREQLLVSDEQNTAQPIQKIIRSFYEKLLISLPEDERPLATDILQLLVLNEHTRNFYHGEAIVTALKNSYTQHDIEYVLKKLDSDTRLIRSEGRAGGVYYEINSESLIPHISDLKKEKEQRERDREQQEKEKTLEEQLQQERIEKEEEKKRAVEYLFLKEKISYRYKILIIFIFISVVMLVGLTFFVLKSMVENYKFRLEITKFYIISAQEDLNQAENLSEKINSSDSDIAIITGYMEWAKLNLDSAKQQLPHDAYVIYLLPGHIRQKKEDLSRNIEYVDAEIKAKNK